MGRVLGEVAPKTGTFPARIVLDSGTECTSDVMDKWAYEHDVELAFIRPGKPVGPVGPRVSTVSSGMNASTCTGLPASRTPSAASKPGGSTTTKSASTARSATCPPQSSPERRASSRRPPPSHSFACITQAERPTDDPEESPLPWYQNGQQVTGRIE